MAIDNSRLMIDLSSNNPLPDLKAHYKAGYRTIALKATESTSYTWPAHGRLADEWHKLGGHVWHYHFTRPGDGAAQARYFLKAVKGHWQNGDRLVCDAEVDGVSGPVVRRFIETCHTQKPDAPGAVYSYSSFIASHGIKPAHGWGLWLAAYQATKPNPAPPWTELAAWQHTDRKTNVPGMGGPVDESRLYVQAAPEPKPEPAVKATRVGAVTRWALRFVTRRLNKRTRPPVEQDRAVLHNALVAIDKTLGRKG